MSISELSDFDDIWSSLNVSGSETAVWNGRELRVIDQKETNGNTLAQIVLASFPRSSSGAVFKIQPMASAGVSVSAERDEEGNSKGTVEGHVSAQSDDRNSTFEFRGEFTATNEGNISGKVEASYEIQF